jgi:hypothetical protein
LQPKDKNEMTNFGEEGRDPAAREAAEAWQRRFGREGHEGSYALHHQSYQQYRQRHAEELDRDYAEWCRSREEEFGRDFRDFRDRQQQPAGLVPGAPMTNDPGDSSALAEDRAADTLVSSGALEPAGTARSGPQR